MQRLLVFQHQSLDGYFADRDGGMAWAKTDDDEEFNAFGAESAQGDGLLLFGRVTYEFMASFWPTPQAYASLPLVAERMNNGPKLVFSRTLTQASWSNTTLVNGDLAAEIRRMKREPGPGMAILGSGSIVAQLATEGVIDEYQIVVNPIALGDGRTMFAGIREPLSLTLTKSRTFRNGKVLLCYEPASGRA